MPLSVGSVLAGRYEVVAPIATGGMGEVWQARDRTLGRIVALKVLRSEYAGDTSFLIRFRNEARHTASLSHPNIASVYDYGESQQDGQRLAYLVMEYVEGKPLVSLLAEFGRLTADQTLDVLAQAGDGLSAAHAAGMVHRDIKPGNLLVRPDGVVKLTDFGIARARDAVPLTRTGMVVGTAQYLSPEQAQGFPVTPASDVYSLGVVGYECLAGGRPFDGESQVAIALAQINRPPPPLPADVPPAARALIERALAKDPSQRFTDGGAFADAARDVAAGVVVPAAATALADQDQLGTTVLPVTGGSAVVGPGTAPRTGVRTGPRTVPPLPPLAVGPADEDGAPGSWDDDGWTEDTGSGRRTRWIALAAVLAVLLVAGGVFVLLRNGADDPADGAAQQVPQPSSTRTVASGDVLVDASQYIGKPVADVKTALEAKKLTVHTEVAPDYLLAELTKDMPAGRVVSTDPVKASVAPNTTVTVYYTQDRFTVSSPATSGSGQPGTSASGTPAPDGAPGGSSSAAPGSSAAATSRPPADGTANPGNPGGSSAGGGAGSSGSGGSKAPTSAPSSAPATDPPPASTAPGSTPPDTSAPAPASSAGATTGGAVFTDPAGVLVGAATP